jgi:hypothetical protein
MQSKIKKDDLCFLFFLHLFCSGVNVHLSASKLELVPVRPNEKTDYGRKIRVFIFLYNFCLKHVSPPLMLNKVQALGRVVLHVKSSLNISDLDENGTDWRSSCKIIKYHISRNPFSGSRTPPPRIMEKETERTEYALRRLAKAHS